MSAYIRIRVFRIESGQPDTLLIERLCPPHGWHLGAVDISDDILRYFVTGDERQAICFTQVQQIRIEVTKNEAQP